MFTGVAVKSRNPWLSFRPYYAFTYPSRETVCLSNFVTNFPSKFGLAEGQAGSVGMNRSKAYGSS